MIYNIISLSLSALLSFNFFSVFQNNTNQDINTKEYDWYYLWKKEGPPDPPKETKNFIFKYDCHFLGNTESKELYLTFDEGYENGNTNKILDTLKKHNVKAAFFVVKPYITQNQDIVKRMVEEGHLVCNHSSTHPSMATIYDDEKFKKEFTEVEDAFEKLTGKKMPKFFRPPMGKYSELSLSKTQQLGYKTIFWSFAYKDWLVNLQPAPAYARNKIISKTHNGGIILLHAVSDTNAQILDEVITEWKSQGYIFKNLDELK